MRQLAQRITGRYHLLPLNAQEAGKYIAFRLETAGAQQMLFSNRAVKSIAQYTHGIPRLINLVCDKALQLSFHQGEKTPSQATVEQACQQIMSFQAEVYQAPVKQQSAVWPKLVQYSALSALGLGLAWGTLTYLPQNIDKWLVTEQTNVALEPQVKTAIQTPVEMQAEPEAPLLPDDIALQLTQGTSRASAIQDLYQLWGYQSSLRDGLCLSEPQSVFVCVEGQATLRELIQLNSPVVLNLTFEEESYHAVLYGLSDKSVELLVNQSLVQIPVSALEALWQGDYVAIWKQPLRETLREGDSGEAVALLDLLLSEVLGENVTGQEQFDNELKRKVEAFQVWQGMSVDGIAGKRTLARLQRIAQLDSPILMSINEERG